MRKVSGRESNINYQNCDINANSVNTFKTHVGA